MHLPKDVQQGDCVIIEELRLPARVGVYDYEKSCGQTICISLKFGLPSQACFRTDNVADTIDYAQVAEALRRLTVSQHFNLIEYLAEQVARLVIDEFGALWVRVKARKIGIVPDAAFVGAVITRLNVKTLGLTEMAGTARQSARTRNGAHVPVTADD